MMKNFFALLLFIFPTVASAQITDDFSDGDFTNNPTWSGDDSQFMVNASQQLQLNSTGTATSYLSFASNLASLDSIEWDFYIHLNFAGSSSNYGRVYLSSDQANLEGSLNGYYLQFGEALSNDAIELFKQTGTTSSSVARGTNGFISASFTVSVKVTRSSTGLWTIYADPAAGANYSFQASGTDLTYTTAPFFGVVCNYTTSNSTNFYFDNFFIGNIAVDLTPPSLSVATATTSSHVDLTFSEAVDQTTAETASNYSVNNGLGNPTSAVRDLSNFALVHINFGSSFTSGLQNTLTVNNVQDLSSNTIAANSTINFTYNAPVSAAQYDVVFNEIMFEPAATNPDMNAEFVEIFNRSNKVLNLAGWTITDGSTSIATLGNLTLYPDSFLIVCANGSATLLSQFGATLGTSSFPALNNDVGDDLKMFGAGADLIDEVNFNNDFYHDNNKDDGGYTIEKIDPNFTCPNSSNWSASNSPSGGTPGKINSVHGTFVDNISPQVVRVYTVNSSTVDVFFTEVLDNSTVFNSANYSIDHGIGQPFSVIPGDSKVTLTFSQVMQTGIIYHLTLNNQLKDCSGNLLSGDLIIRLGVSEEPDTNSVVINEILFNPKTGGYDFVELFNNSTKIIDLLPLNIANVDVTTHEINDSYPITNEGYLLFPGDYVALTENPVAVQSQYPLSNIKNYLTVPSMPSFNDADGGVAIVNFSLKKLDQFIYSDKWQFALLNDNEGVSLERISFNRPTQDSSNWHSASETVGFATPGYKNSQADDTKGDGSEVNVDPELFSPDNDGYHDVLNIHYKFDNPGYTANLTVYDSDGREIRKLVRNELLGANDGTFSWDGINDDNEKGRAGIYILYFEAFSENGEVKKFKKPFVLATKL